MAVSLAKGGHISLHKVEPRLQNVYVGLGWDAVTIDDAFFDLDVSAFLITKTGKVRSDADFIYYNQMASACGSVRHAGYTRSGDGGGDDEVIHVALQQVPADIAKIVFTMTIHEAEYRKQNFRQVGNAYIRLVNFDSDAEVVCFKLGEQYDTETAIVFGELYRQDSLWEFSAIGDGYSGGLPQMAQKFGVSAKRPQD